MREKLEKYADSLNIEQPELDNLNPIQFASKHGYADFIEQNLKKIHKNQWPSILELATSKGRFTALHYAAFLGHLNCALVLVSSGAKVTQLTSLQQLPIQLALTNKSISRETKQAIFNVLNIDPTLLMHANLNGDTVAHLAAEANLPDILITIRQMNEKVLSIKNKQGQTPLLVSILNSSMSSARVLMEYTPSLQERDSKERNAMHYAALYGDIVCVSLLLPYFDLKQRDYDGNTAYDYLAKRQDPVFSEILSMADLQFQR